MRKSSGQLVLEARQVIRRAESEGRNLTAEEQAEFDRLLNAAGDSKSAADTRREVDALSRELGSERKTLGYDSSPFVGGLGDQFVESQGYKSLIARGLGSGSFSTGPIELETKGTLTTTAGTGLTPAGYTPGVVQMLFQRP